jgi:hypothetical protein
MTLRYTIDGQVKEGELLGSPVGGSNTRNGTGNKQQKTWEEMLEDVLGDLGNIAGAMKDKQQKPSRSVADAIARSRQIQDTERQFRNPGTEDVTIGRSGLMRTADSRDQALSDTDRALRNLTIVLSHLVTLLGQYGVNGKRFVMDGVYQLISMDDEYPAAMKPFGDLMTERCVTVLMETFLQGNEMLAIEGLKDIARSWAKNLNQSQ